MASSRDCKTQGTLARKSGVGQTTIGRILRGEVNPQTATVTFLATALGMQLKTLAAEVEGAVVNLDLKIYRDNVQSARESAQFYFQLARNAKARNDVRGWLDCWYKGQAHRVTMRYWMKIIREYPVKLAELETLKESRKARWSGGH